MNLSIKWNWLGLNKQLFDTQAEGGPAQVMSSLKGQMDTGMTLALYKTDVVGGPHDVYAGWVRARKQNAGNPGLCAGPLGS